MRAFEDDREFELAPGARGPAAPAPGAKAGALFLEAICAGSRPLRFVFQPIVDLKRGIVAGFEALARFPAGECASPGPWLRYAAQLGLRPKLEAVAIRTAVESRNLLPDNCFLNVNVGPGFLLSPDWRKTVAEIGDFTRLVVEVTEDEAVEDFDEIRRRLAEIRDHGGSIAIDDAGAGYASLNQILQLRPDFVKLDSSFALNCGVDRAKSALIEMVGQFAGRLDAWLIVEGVETLTDLEEVIRLGAPLAQGRFFGRPAPTMEILDQPRSAGLKDVGRGLKDRIGLGPVMESCTSCESADAAEHLMIDAQLTLAILDQWRRPIAIVERRAREGVRVIAKLTRVHPDSSPSEVLERALTRPVERRFDPLAVIDHEGLFVGIVRIDRLAAERNRAGRPAAVANPDRGPYTC